MRGRLTRYITEAIAARNKTSFLKEFSVDWLLNNNEYPSLTIASFSGEKQLADQLYSITSFYRNVGKPGKWIIFSDGSHSEKSKELFNNIPEVVLIDDSIDIVPEAYKNETNPLLKKVFYYKTVDVKTTTFFVDSDILFYKSFTDFYPLLLNHNWFMVDEQYGSFDTSYVENVNFDLYPCNSGFFVLNKQPQWDVVMRYLDDQRSKPEGIQYWSEQTAFHVLTRDFTNYLPLDPRYFVVGGPDSFSLTSHFDYTKIAMRHFVGPVRHKMWQYSWKKILGIES